FPEAFLMLLHQGVGLDQRLEAVRRVAQVGSGFRQHGVIVWNEHHCPGGLSGGDPLVCLCPSLLALALNGQGPSTEDCPAGHPECKALVVRERNSGLYVLVHSRYIPATL